MCTKDALYGSMYGYAVAMYGYAVAMYGYAVAMYEYAFNKGRRRGKKLPAGRSGH